MPKVKEMKYKAPALEKGLEVIELLSNFSDGLNLSEIASKLSRTNAELFRMVSVLKDLDYLEYNQEERRYKLSLKLFRLSHNFSPIESLVHVAEPLLERLANESGHPCYIVCYSEGSGVVVSYKSSENSFNQLAYKVGMKLPLVNSCAGHVLLSFSCYNTRKSMLDSYLVTSGQEIEFQKLRKHIEDIKRQGYEAMESPVFLSGFDIGFPIYEEDNRVNAVLVMSTLVYRDPKLNISLEELKRKVGTVATDISTRMGYKKS